MVKESKATNCQDIEEGIPMKVVDNLITNQGSLERMKS